MKIKLFVIFLLFFIIELRTKAQDLTFNSGNIVNTSIVTNNLFHIQFTITNIGSATAMQCYIGIYISLNNNGTGLIPMGFVSCQSLGSGWISAPIDYKLPLPYSIQSGTYYVYIYANPNISTSPQVYETNYGNNLAMLPNILNVMNGYSPGQNIPYPILFVHGLSGSGNSWWNFSDSILSRRYGWYYGGELDFCLNQDANTCTGGTYYNEVKDWTFGLTKGDFYLLNFSVDHNGTTYWATNDPDESNQSAIVKQGYALQLAINDIKSITGAQKVIVMGHSMGGLAGREYLQGNFYQGDVAKLVECATPNQGSDAFFPLGYINNKTIDWQSEAQRDLKHTYDTGYNGCFLSGGSEDANIVCECNAIPVSFNFYNVDVNCDGNTNCSGSSYQSITGLNNMPHPDINYSCVIGYGDNTVCNSNSYDGDDVVENWSANLYNVFSGSRIDTFWTLPRATYNCTNTMHCDMTGALYDDINIKALDEPDYFDDTTNGSGHAYGIDINKLYYGLMTKKNNDPTNSTMDYDDYKFILTSTTNITINVYNINISDMDVAIWDVNQNQYSTNYGSWGSGNITFSMNNVPAGTYYIELKGTPTDFSWWRAYGFEILGTSTTDVQENELENLISIFPNPSSGVFTVKNNENMICKIKILNLIGEVIYEQDKISSHKTEIDLSKQANGFYFLQINSEKGSINKKVVINK